ncbi:MAG: MotA/TolQ/ExbB proton channel family protein [Desulfobacterales bacterium]
MGGKVNAAVLAGGIWEAMLTTALGLCVAPAHHGGPVSYLLRPALTVTRPGSRADRLPFCGLSYGNRRLTCWFIGKKDPGIRSRRR